MNKILQLLFITALCINISASSASHDEQGLFFNAIKNNDTDNVAYYLNNQKLSSGSVGN